MLYVLNLEDNMFKHHKICDVLKSSGFGRVEIDNARNLEAGLEMIQSGFDNGRPYDLIVTDMWYPERMGSGDAASGEVFINRAKENGWDIPIILCSSVNYLYPGILGSLHYSENEDWEGELIRLVRKII